MIISKLQLKSIISMTIALGLVISSAFAPVRAEGVAVGAFQNTTAAPVAEEKTAMGTTIAIGIGAATGLVLYGLATWDWSWTWFLDASAARAVIARAIPTGIARSAASAGTTAAVRTAVPAVAATTVPAVATRVARVGTSGVVARSSAMLASRWFLITASALTGAYIGNAIYTGK